MRIPTYISERTVSAPQIETTRIQPLKLDAVVGAIENQYQQAVKREEEDFQLFAETEAQRTQLAIDQKYAEIKDRIANGGSYAKAVQEFQSFYDATTKKSLSQFGDDRRGNIASQKIGLQYEKSGVEYSLRLKDAVRSRAKSDAVASANVRLEAYQREFVEAKTPEEMENAIAKANSAIAGAWGGDQGKAKAAKFVSQSLSLKALLMSQDDPLGAYEMVEQQKDSMDVEDYVPLRGVLKEKAADYDYAQEVQSNVDAFYGGEAVVEPDQEGVDAHERDATRQVAAGQMTTDQYEQNITNVITASGKVPAVVKSRIETAFASDHESITPQVAAEVARYSRIVDAATKSDATLINGTKGGLDKETQQIAKAIASKTARGIDEATAVRETLMKYNDPVFKEAYKDAKSVITKVAVTGVKSPYTRFVNEAMDELDISEKGVALIRNDLVDDYATGRAMGMSPKDAKQMAFDRQRGVVGKFNGVDVLMPPHKVTTLRSEKKWKESAMAKIEQYRSAVKEAGVYDPYLENIQEPVLFGDENTRRVIEEGGNVLDIPFRLGYKDENGNVVPITNPVTGELSYVVANPEMFVNTSQYKARKTKKSQSALQTLNITR